MPLDEMTSEDARVEKKLLKEEKKKLKNEKKQQKKEAKQRAKEIANREAELYDEAGDGGTASVFAVTFVIVLIWVAILCLIVKLDIGGFGSNILTPVLKDVPVLNKILPNDTQPADEAEEEMYGGYEDLKEAVDYIKELELELERAQSSGTANSEEISQLKAEVERLKTFEDSQVEFQRIKTEFYEEVVYADNGPGIEEYRKYYEEMDPATAEYLYKQVVQEIEESDEIRDYAQTYSAMKPKAAAAIFEAMTDNLDLVARILGVMEAEDRGKILGVMDPEIASKLTKIMDPES